MNNKKLLLILGGLLLIWLAMRLLGGNKNRSFDPVLAQIDSNQISSILLYPAEAGQGEIKLERTGTTWKGTFNGITTDVMESSVRGMLDYFALLEAERIVAKSEQKWPDYEVDEGKGTRVKALAGDRTLIDMVVGRFSFDQMSRSATSYVRLHGKPEVYALEGFVSMTFNRGFDSFRDKSILRLERDQVVSLDYSAGDHQHTLVKNGNIWTLDGQRTLDSTTVAEYLSGLSYLTGNTFADGFQPAGQPVYRLKIKANQLINPMELSCYAVQDSMPTFILNSSLNPKSFFRGDSSTFYAPVFEPWRVWTK